MMKCNFYILIISLNFVSIGNGLTIEDKQRIIFSFAEKNYIRQIVLNQEDENCFAMTKALARSNMFSACWQQNRIKLYPNTTSAFFGLRLLFVVELKLLGTIFRPFLKIENTAYKDNLIMLFEQSWIVWLTFNEKNEDLSKKLSVPYNTNAYIVESTNEKEFKIYETYFLNGVFFFTLKANWSAENGMIQVSESSQPRLLTGVSIKRQYFNEKNYGPYNSILKPGHEILDGISKLLNFSYILLNASDVNFFNFDISDSLTAMVPHYLFSIVGPTTKIKMSIFIQGTNGNMLSTYFVQPFSLNMWFAIMLWIILAMCTIAAIHYLAQEKQVILDNTTSVLEAFFNQSGSWVDVSLHSRIYRAATWLTVGLVLPSYTAVIISFMTIRQTNIPFQDLHDLANNGRYRLGIQKGSVPLMMLKMDKSLSADLEKILVPESELPEEVTAAASLICKNKYAFIGYNEIIRELPNICPIVKIKKPVMELYTALYLTPFSPLSAPFTSRLVYFRSNGMMNRFQKKIDENPFTFDGPDILPVNFDLIRDAFGIFLYGLATSFIIFLLEHCSKTYKKYCARKRKEQNLNLA